jgi:flavin-dependent dehydrogenase
MVATSTLNLSAAAVRRWDAIVIGAGPAGALAARQLAQRGLAVLLVDRDAFPRWKVCGACLGGAALDTLAAVGLDELVDEHGGVPLTTMQLVAGGRRACMPLADRVALSRTAFDAALIDAAVRAGAALLLRTWARLADVTASERRVVLRQTDAEVLVAGSIVISATGLGGSDAVQQVVQPKSRIGVGTVAGEAPIHYAPGTIYMACGTGGYVGLVRVEDGRLNIAAAVDADAVRQRGGVGPLGAEILAQAGLPAVPAMTQLPWRGTPALTRQPVRPAATRLFLIGDAAGYVEPFTGEGIAWALAGAVSVAPIAAEACRRWDPALAATWSVCHRRIITRRQWPCRWLAALLRRPPLMRTAVAMLERMPLLAAPITWLQQASLPRQRRDDVPPPPRCRVRLTYPTEIAPRIYADGRR